MRSVDGWLAALTPCTCTAACSNAPPPSLPDAPRRGPARGCCVEASRSRAKCIRCRRLCRPFPPRSCEPRGLCPFDGGLGALAPRAHAARVRQEGARRAQVPRVRIPVGCSSARSGSPRGWWWLVPLTHCGLRGRCWHTWAWPAWRKGFLPSWCRGWQGRPHGTAKALWCGGSRGACRGPGGRSVVFYSMQTTRASLIEVFVAPGMSLVHPAAASLRAWRACSHPHPPPTPRLAARAARRGVGPLRAAERAERPQCVAGLGEAGSPWAGAAMRTPFTPLRC